MDNAITVGQVAHGHAHEHEHEELGFWRKYVFSVDHKVIGIQYAVTGLLFLLFGFTLMMMMRFQLAYPGHPIPLIGSWFGPDKAPGGIMLPEFYNQLGAMHGTIMVFLGVVPLAVGGFGNFVMPLQIGAPDMAFPKLNMMSYWVYFLGGVVMLVELLRARRRGAVRLDVVSAAVRSSPRRGQTMWLIGMVFLITSSLLGSVNFIVTIVQLRAKGLSFMRLPFFVWAQFVTVVPAAARVSAARSGRRPAADGPPRRARASSCRAASSSSGKVAARSPAAATRCSGSTCSGSSRIPRCTS